MYDWTVALAACTAPTRPALVGHTVTAPDGTARTALVWRCGTCQEVHRWWMQPRLHVKSCECGNAIGIGRR